MNETPEDLKALHAGAVKAFHADAVEPFYRAVAGLLHGLEVDRVPYFHDSDIVARPWGEDGQVLRIDAGTLDVLERRYGPLDLRFKDDAG